MLDWLTEQHHRTRRQVEYSIGWVIGQPERAAIGALPATAWSPALAADGHVRESAQVVELTGLLHLPGWPKDMRVIVRLGCTPPLPPPRKRRPQDKLTL